MASASAPTHPDVPAQPRDASTVIIARPAPGGAPEIYMVLRSARSPFMPGTLVFPGGRVDPADGPPGTADAFERAARRECLEEVDLDLADSSLRWFDNWITPSGERRRYHARFFLAVLGPHQGSAARADGLETHDGRWGTVTDHLAGWEREEVDLPPPTLCTLLRLRDLDLPGLRQVLESLDPAQPILPKWTTADGRFTVVLPHAPEYGELPGAGGPLPSRVRDLPVRFIRNERRWIPCD